MEMLNLLNTDNVKPNEKEHVPSTLQADTLFNFTSKLDYLLETIRNKMLSPRYCSENIEAFHIPGINNLVYPMKCFCDINLHRLKDHIDWYGPYGIAFTKEWGMDKGIQPVQYINSHSALCEDMAFSFGQLLTAGRSEPGSLQETLESFSLLQIMYWKPYQGPQKKRPSDEGFTIKCFCDESEWRFIPDVTVLGMPMIIRDQNILLGGLLKEYNDALVGKKEVSLVFDYKDIKHIILNEKNDYKMFEEEVESWGLDMDILRELRSKVLIWKDIKEDV